MERDNSYDYMKLPEFQEAKKHIEAAGYKADWITEIVDPNESGAIFIQPGKLHKCDCEYYDGYWLCGGFSSVKCKARKKLLPGMMYVLICSINYMNCPFYKEMNN